MEDPRISKKGLEKYFTPEILKIILMAIFLSIASINTSLAQPITLIPGIIRDIRIVSLDSRANWYTAFPTRPGPILNLRDLEQGLEQLKRVPSQDADMKITPGDKPGESDVLITIKSTTPIRMTLSLDNLFGMNDLFYISFNKDAAQQDYRYGTHGNNYQYSMP